MRTVKVYLAGMMKWLDSEDSIWKCCVPALKEEIRRLMPQDVEVLSPDEVGFDHGGDLVYGIVEADIKLIDDADLLVAVFSTPNQVGTITELLHALSSGKQCLAVFTDNVVSVGGLGIGPQVIKRPLEVRCESDHYWFLINYLVRYKIQCTVVAARPEDVDIAILRWLKRLASCKRALSGGNRCRIE